MTTSNRSAFRVAYRLIPVLLCFCTLGVYATAGPERAPEDDDEGRKGSVWVVNRDKGELAVFDAETGAVLHTLLVGAGAHDVCISERTGKAYITAEAIHTVTTVDMDTFAKIGRAHV